MVRYLFILTLLLTLPNSSYAEFSTYDLADSVEGDGTISRVYGSDGSGTAGVPVAAGGDVDGDNNPDFAVAHFQASPLSRTRAGQIDLVFGNRTIGPFYDTAVSTDTRILRIYGDEPGENTGSEIWIDDVNGDGLADVLICRQNYSADITRVGVGALSIIFGSADLRTQANALIPIDLRDAPTTGRLDIIGASPYDRLGIWVRTGDVTGDDIADIVLGADQVDGTGTENQGAVYLIRGGSHLLGPNTIDLANFGSTALAGHLAQIDPPLGSDQFHLGSTCQIADLDGNGRGEVLMSAALIRAGAGQIPIGAPGSEYQSSGGAARGKLFIVWDDYFSTTTWATGYRFAVTDGPGSFSVIQGGLSNVKFGEEIVGNADYDADGFPDLFVGDIIGLPPVMPVRNNAGMGHVFFKAGDLKGLQVDLDNYPSTMSMTTVYGPSVNAIGADTALNGDFNKDGFTDLAIGNPCHDPQGRDGAGSIVVFFGQTQGWPSIIDTEPTLLPGFTGLDIVDIHGAIAGDVLCYSAVASDVDQDGFDDLVVNEMKADGLAPGSDNVGNLIIINGASLMPIHTAVRTPWIMDAEQIPE